MEFKKRFDENSANWTHRPVERNSQFVNSQTLWLMELLRAKGVVFLNEALEIFGFDRVREGQTYGWSEEVWVRWEPEADGTGWIRFQKLEKVVDVLPSWG